MLGIGVDIVFIDRIRRICGLLSSPKALVEVLFSEEEVARLGPIEGKALFREIAAGLAIKEAVIKATVAELGLGDLRSIVACGDRCPSRATSVAFPGGVARVSIAMDEEKVIALALEE